MTDTLTLDALAAVKEKQQATWASGDYAVIGTSLQIIGERALRVGRRGGGAEGARRRRRQRQRVARRRLDGAATVTATDYVESLLERARRRADADGLPLTTQVADAEDLPFEDAQLRRRALDRRRDVHAEPGAGGRRARPRRAPRRPHRARQLDPRGLRRARCSRSSAPTCRRPPASRRRCSGGPRPASHELLGGEAKVEIERRHFAFRFRSAEDYFETFKEFYGPLVKAWAALDADGQRSIREQLVALADGANRNADGALTVDSEYLEVVATRR